jgi:hypothetical protein
MYTGHVHENTLMELKRQALRARDHALKVVDRFDSSVTAASEAAETAAAAFAFGVANGKVGGAGLRVPVLGVPADLAFGVGVHVVTLLAGVKEDKARHYRAFANGALGSYFSTLGAQVGDAWKRRGGGIHGLLGAMTDSDPTVTGGGSLADEELARMVRP